MANKNEKTLSGLPATDEPRKHYDIYAILEAPQELYFGHEKEVNINIVEKVRVWTPEGEKEKCYISPTKRRGVERRCLLWSDAGGVLFMDKLECGIPNTCCKDSCPVCAVFGGLEAGKKTFIGRLTHSGGVAVSGQIALEKQRAMHPALVRKEKEETPMPYRKEYAQPGLLYPVSNHCLSITEAEFSTAAYAFLMSLNRLGAGNPKGVSFARADWNGGKAPLLVVDEYRVPFGERPIVSPAVTENDLAIQTFIDLAGKINTADENLFRRVSGDTALKRLQDAASSFVSTHLQRA
ncbi:MAG: hypothetical protein RBT16_08055 [Desulfococcus multivorans]|nr:hypothetical protein [Desulfococcus multivorans]